MQIRYCKREISEHLKRQIAVAIGVAVEGPPFLMAGQGVVGRVKVGHDLARRPIVRLEEQIDQQALDRRPVVADLVAAASCPGLRRMLQPVERALAGQRGRRVGRRVELTEPHPQNRVVAQRVVVDPILVAPRQVTRCAISVLTACATEPGLRRSRKQAAKRSTSPMALSVSDKSSPRRRKTEGRRQNPQPPDAQPFRNPPRPRDTPSALGTHFKSANLLSQNKCTRFEAPMRPPQ